MILLNQLPLLSKINFQISAIIILHIFCLLKMRYEHKNKTINQVLNLGKHIFPVINVESTVNHVAPTNAT